MTRKLQIGLVQQSHTAQRATNLEHSIASIRQLAAQGAQLVVLSELHASLYFCQLETPERFLLAEPIPGPTTEQLSNIARELKLVIVGSIFEQRAPGIYHNTAVVFEKDGSIAGKYRKMHIPDDPGYYEKFYFTPGDLGFTPIDTSVGRLGILVCWDQWFPEAARLMALAGAEILIYPTAIGWDTSDPDTEKKRQHEAWITIQRAHAIANGMPVAVCNRVGLEIHGDEKGIDFWGSSFIAGPQGEFIAQAKTDKPELLLAEIDFAHIETVRRIWPFFRDRRIDAYNGLMMRYLDPR